MISRSRQTLTSSLLLMLIFVTLTPRAAAQDHVLKSGELEQALVEASRARVEKLETISRFLESETARQALQQTRIDVRKVEQALAVLSDEELSRLAVQVERIQSDVIAGALTNQEITYIIIALVTAVIILVIVAS